MKACMGGFCQKREKCQHYAAPVNKYRPAERLCTPGQEEMMFFTPLRKQQSPVKAEQEQMV